MVSIFAFLKFGQKRHIMDLFHNGTVYMNSVEYFRKLEDDGVRGDSYEGVSRIDNLPSGKFYIPSINHEGKYQSLHLKSAYEEVYGNIYSLFCISSLGWKDPCDFFIDQRIKEFGSHCLLIKRTDVFLNMIEKELSRQNLKFRHGFISYYDKHQISRDVHLFEKPNDLEYQNEFRIYIQRNSTDSFVLNIGCLEDVAEIYETSIFVDNLRLQHSV